jgi:hypothetical protein
MLAMISSIVCPQPDPFEAYQTLWERYKLNSRVNDDTRKIGDSNNFGPRKV